MQPPFIWAQAEKGEVLFCGSVEVALTNPLGAVVKDSIIVKLAEPELLVL